MAKKIDKSAMRRQFEERPSNAMTKENLKTLALQLSLASPASYCAECEGELYPVLDKQCAERNVRISELRSSIERSGKDVHDADGEVFQRIARKSKAASKLLARMPFGRPTTESQSEPASKSEFMALLGEIEESALTAVYARIGSRAAHRG